MPGIGLPTNRLLQKGLGRVDGQIAMRVMDDLLLLHLSAVQDLHSDSFSDPVATWQGQEIVHVAHRLALHRDDHIGHEQVASICGAVCVDRDREQTGFVAHLGESLCCTMLVVNVSRGTVEISGLRQDGG